MAGRNAESRRLRNCRVLRRAQTQDLPLPDLPLQFSTAWAASRRMAANTSIVLGEGLRTPEPWINVIANPDFGFLVSESGAGFTWSLNSHENQITPWSNDHVIDPPGEAIYLRDEDTGEVWTPTALPNPRRGRHVHRAPRPRLQPLPARFARHRAGTRPICARRTIP